MSNLCLLQVECKRAVRSVHMQDLLSVNVEEELVAIIEVGGHQTYSIRPGALSHVLDMKRQGRPSCVKDIITNISI